MIMVIIGNEVVINTMQFFYEEFSSFIFKVLTSNNMVVLLGLLKMNKAIRMNDRKVATTRGKGLGREKQ